MNVPSHTLGYLIPHLFLCSLPDYSFFLLVCGRLSVASFVGVRLFHLISFYRS